MCEHTSAVGFTAHKPWKMCLRWTLFNQKNTLMTRILKGAAAPPDESHGRHDQARRHGAPPQLLKREHRCIRIHLINFEHSPAKPSTHCLCAAPVLCAARCCVLRSVVCCAVLYTTRCCIAARCYALQIFSQAAETTFAKRAAKCGLCVRLFDLNGLPHPRNLGKVRRLVRNAPRRAQRRTYHQVEAYARASLEQSL